MVVQMVAEMERMSAAQSAVQRDDWTAAETVRLKVATSVASKDGTLVGW